MAGDSATENRLAAALAAAGELAYSWDLKADRIEWFGPVAELLPGLGPVIASGSGFAALVEPSDRQRRQDALARLLSNRERLTCRYRLVAADGPRHVHESGFAEWDATGEPVCLSGTLRVLSGDDSGTFRHENRAGLRAAIQDAVNRSSRGGRSGTYLAIDIDNLARINDAFGFDAGDAVIAEMESRLRRFLRGRDTVARVSGGGFGLLLQNCNENGVAAAADRIVRALRENPVETPGGLVAATVSLGAVVFPGSAHTPDDVMTRAEIALQQAKRAGRNHSVLYQRSDAQRRSLREGNGIARLVQQALADDRLVLAYQPVVESGSGTPAFYECLLRLRREDGQLMAAGQFVPVVEQLGMMRQIDRRVFDLVAEELEANPEARLAFNISGYTTGDERWLDAVVDRLKRRPDVASRLIVELTETAALQDIEESVRFVSTLRDLGCRIALDDFGAGYSSFRHLKTLPLDIVKIDGAYVRDLASRADNQVFIRTLLGLTQAFGLASVAEFVETGDDADLLAQQGVGFLQGWHFGRPELVRPVSSCSSLILPERGVSEAGPILRAG